MLSIGSQLALSNPAVLHSFVDSFFEGKKALVKERLMESVKVVVDGLFEEMVGQVKEMLLPPKTDNVVQIKPPLSVVPNTTPPTKAFSTSLPTAEKPKTKLIFATKSKPSTSAQPPFSGLYKRMAEEDGSSSSTQPKKKQAISVEIDGNLVLPNFDDQELQEEEDHILGKTGDDAEVLKATSSRINIPSTSKRQQQQNQPPQSGKTAYKMVPCPDCGKLFIANNLKRHQRTHSKVKPYSCTYSGCTGYESENRHNVIRHIKSTHLSKNLKSTNEDGNDDDDDGDPPDNGDATTDPTVYLHVNQQLL